MEAGSGGQELGLRVRMQEEIFFSDRDLTARGSVSKAGRVGGCLGCDGARAEGNSGTERVDSRQLNMVDEVVENCVDSQASAEGDGGMIGVRQGAQRQSLGSSRKRRSAWAQMRKAANGDQQRVERRGRGHVEGRDRARRPLLVEIKRLQEELVQFNKRL